MKNFKNVLIVLTLVLTLGVVSCNDNEVEPTPQVNLTLADFDGTWISTSTDFNGVNYSSAIVCSELVLKINGGASIHFFIDGVAEKISLLNPCNKFKSIFLDVTFDETTLIIVLTGSFDQKFQITKYDLESTPQTASIKLIDEGLDGNLSDAVGATYNLVKQ